MQRKSWTAAEYHPNLSPCQAYEDSLTGRCLRKANASGFKFARIDANIKTCPSGIKLEDSFGCKMLSWAQSFKGGLYKKDM